MDGAGGGKAEESVLAVSSGKPQGRKRPLARRRRCSDPPFIRGRLRHRSLVIGPLTDAAGSLAKVPPCESF